MRRYTLILLALALLAISCEKREWARRVAEVDIDSYVYADISGTYRDYKKVRFSSDSGHYKIYDHPELKMHDDGTFSFKLARSLYNKRGEDIHICFYWDRDKNDFEFGKVYPLTLLGKARADIDLYDREGTYHRYHTMYEAVDGWIIFKSRRPYDEGFLFSGEFYFKGKSEDGDMALIENGKFRDCRICWSNDYCCSDF